MHDQTQPLKKTGQNQQEEKLLQIIRELVKELHSVTDWSQPLTLDSSLDRDLGMNSLARMELLDRLERAFAVSLSEQVLVSVESPRDILRALNRASTAAPSSLDLPNSDAAEESQSTIDFIPHDADTLVAVLESHARRNPERIHILFEPKKDERWPLTYGQLHHGAMELAAGLQEHNCDPGETVAIMLPTGIDYFLTFFAVLIAGAIPVPLYPPARPSQIEEHLRRHRGILRNAGAKILITVPEVKLIGALLKSQVDSLKTVETVEAFRGRLKPVYRCLCVPLTSLLSNIPRARQVTLKA